jgi:integrase
MHALRRFYASVLIDAGESVKAVAEYLGHADPGFTLRVYAHLFPSTNHVSTIARQDEAAPVLARERPLFAAISTAP